MHGARRYLAARAGSASRARCGRIARSSRRTRIAISRWSTSSRPTRARSRRVPARLGAPAHRRGVERSAVPADRASRCVPAVLVAQLDAQPVRAAGVRARAVAESTELRAPHLLGRPVPTAPGLPPEALLRLHFQKLGGGVVGAAGRADDAKLIARKKRAPMEIDREREATNVDYMAVAPARHEEPIRVGDTARGTEATSPIRPRWPRPKRRRPSRCRPTRGRKRPKRGSAKRDRSPPSPASAR